MCVCVCVYVCYMYLAMLFVKISEMKLDNFHHLAYSEYYHHFYCYVHSILANVLI